MIHSISEIQSVELRSVLTPAEPLGPPFAERLNEYPEASSLLFASQNNIYGRSALRPGILIGRRGSGKTALLQHLGQTSDHRHKIFIEAPEAFPQIIRSIRDLFAHPPPTVELVEEFWDILVWACVFAAMLDGSYRDDARVQAIHDFALRVGINQSDPPEQTIEKVISVLRERMQTEGLSVETPRELRRAFKFEESSYDVALETARELLTSENSRGPSVLVLMDTLESYNVSQGEAVHALSGLIRFLSQRASARRGVDIRFCLPVELYATFQDASHNPSKDFSSASVLQWHAGDILIISAHRLFLYLSLRNSARHEWLMSHFDVDTRSGAVAFFEHILPAETRNGRGVAEPTLAYILRHTQLLPRHAVHMFNQILSGAIDPTTGTVGEIEARHVSDGIRRAEQDIVPGVIQAYRHRYPHLSDFCRAVLPQLPRRFPDGDLHSAFIKFGGAVLKELRGTEEEIDYRSFKKMLIEVGALGRFQEETAIYYEAEFAYTVPADLIVSLEDDLCLHPIFSTHYRRLKGNGSDLKSVYPYGSDPKAR